MNPSSLTRSIVTLALETNLQRQEAMASFRSTISQKEWFFSVASLYVRLGRGAGHTTTILDLATENDLIICSIPSQKQNFWSAVRSQGLKSKLATFEDIKISDNRFRGLVFDRIWVDDASLINEDQYYLLLDLAVLRKATQIVMLG